MSHHPTSRRPNEKLKRARQLRGWRQQDVADGVDTDAYTVSRWERGVARPGRYFRQRLCELFGQDAEDLGLLEEEPDAAPALDPPAEAGGRSAQGGAGTPDEPAPLAHALYWHVPYHRTPFFTGREPVLQRLHRLLLPAAVAALPQSYALTGLGGIGKTQLAVEYAHCYRQDYSAVFWLGAESQESLLASVVALADCLGLPEQGEREQSKVVAAVLRWLTSHQNWLLLVDNVEDLDLVKRFLPTAGGGSLLFTTRLPTLGILAEMLGVEPLSAQEGRQLLLRRAGTVGPPAALEGLPAQEERAVRALVSALDCLPLALDQAGAYIAQTRCGWAEFLSLFETSPLQMLTEREASAEHPLSVVKTFTIVFERLQRANPAAAELLTLCCFLAPEAIPEALIREHLDEQSLPLQALVRDPLQWNALCRDLLISSLITRDAQAKTMTVHRLVQAVLKKSLAEETQRRWVQRILRLVNQAFPDEQLLWDVAHWPWCEQLLPHAFLVIHQHELRNTTPTELSALLTKIASYLVLRARYTEADPLFQQILGLQEQTWGPHHPEVATALANLGDLYFQQGRYEEAEPFFERALLIREQVLGPEHPQVGQVLNSWGKLHYKKGKHEEAKRLIRRALVIQERTLAPDHPDLASSLNNLAVVYYMQGHYQKAEACYRRALAIRERALGPQHPELCILINNLAMISQQQERYQEAESLYQRAMLIRENTQGPEHPELAFPLTNLATLYYAQGRYQEAEACFRKALAIRERALGPQHPELVSPLTNLATLYARQERIEEAEPLYLRAIQLLERAGGTDHPEICYPCAGLADLYTHQGRYEEAERLFQRALAIWEQRQEPDHPDRQECLKDYALLQRQRRQGEAENGEQENGE